LFGASDHAATRHLQARRVFGADPLRSVGRPVHAQVVRQCGQRRPVDDLAVACELRHIGQRVPFDAAGLRPVRRLPNPLGPRYEEAADLPRRHLTQALAVASDIPFGAPDAYPTERLTNVQPYDYPADSTAFGPAVPSPPPARPAGWPGKKIALIVGGGVGVLLLLCVAGGTAIGATAPAANPTVTVTTTAAAPTVTVTVTESASPAVTTTVTATTTETAAPPPAAAGTTIEDGTWTVGVDVKPGSYRVAVPISSGMCYWGIYRSGTNQRDIVNNGIESGGRPQVTLKAGQDFKSSDCGTWTKVG
jgi:hypothetical protein